MEWVVTSGSTIEEATDMALDELGIAIEDAEVVVLQEPKQGLFGIHSRQARVQARVAPAAVRPKTERRDRKRGGSKKRTKEADASESTPEKTAGKKTAGKKAAAKKAGSRRRTDDDSSADGSPQPDAPDEDRSNQEAPQGEAMTSVSIEDQVEVIEDFLDGLMDAFDLDGEIDTVEIEPEISEVRITGEELGYMIGPKGQTLSAIHELCRTVAQRRLPGPHDGRIRLDIGGYRERRREALQRFATQIAEDVRSSGAEKALEPMSPPDRKVVHDTINEIDGVTTSSEGEEPRRRVVVSPAD